MRTAAIFDLRLPERFSVRWRKPALVAASVLAHVLVLGALAGRTFHLQDVHSEPTLVWLDIQPRPVLPDETPRPRPAAAAAAAARIEVATNASGRASILRRDEDDEDQAPSPHVAPSVPGAPATGGEDAWRYRPESMSGAVARSLRNSPVGCDMRNGRMSAAEQQLCDDRFNERAGRARPISGTDNPERDARFAAEGAAAIDRYERRRRPLAGGTGVVGPADCVGSNFGTGCAGSHIDPSLAPDSNQNIRTPMREGPR